MAVVIVSIMTLLAISSSAFESDEYISLWNAGLENQSYNHNYNSQHGYNYAYIFQDRNDIYFNGIETAEIPPKTIWDKTEFNEVYYTLKFKNYNLTVPHTEYTDIYITYQTSRFISISCEVLTETGYQSIEIDNVTLNNQTMYYGWYFTGNGSTQTDATITSTTQAFKLRVRYNYSNFDEVKIRIKIQFYDTEIESFLENDNSDLFTRINALLEEIPTGTVSSFLRRIIAVQWITNLMILGILTVIIFVLFNWLRSL